MKISLLRALRFFGDYNKFQILGSMILLSNDNLGVSFGVDDRCNMLNLCFFNNRDIEPYNYGFSCVKAKIDRLACEGPAVVEFNECGKVKRFHYVENGKCVNSDLNWIVVFPQTYN